MVITNGASLPRCSAVWVSTTLAVGALVAWLLPALVAADLTTFDRALTWICAGASVLAACWLWIGTSVVTAAALAGRAPVVPGLPTPVRRLVLAACGVALVGGLAAPAVATPGRPQESRHPQTSAVALAGLPMPDRAASALPGGALLRTGPAHAPRAVPAGPTTVVVAPGDSLWAIASRDLGPGATDADIAARWQRIYQLNRAAVGPDPDLVQPALRLRMPAR